MITGEVKNKLDNLWDAMWSNQMTNPLIDIQQITYLIFIKMLDDQQIKKERKLNDMVARGIKIENFDKDLIFKDGFYINEIESLGTFKISKKDFYTYSRSFLRTCRSSARSGI